MEGLYNYKKKSENPRILAPCPTFGPNFGDPLTCVGRGIAKNLPACIGGDKK